MPSPPKARNTAIGLAEGICALSGLVFIPLVPVALAMEDPTGERWPVWVLAISGVVFAGSGLAVWRQARRKDVYPDLLAEVPVVPFECEGVLLVPVYPSAPISPTRMLRHAFLFQNRFDARATIDLGVEPGPRFHLEVEAGEVGLAWEDHPVPPCQVPGELGLTLVASGRREPGREVRFRKGGILGNRTKENAWLLAGLAVGTVVLTKQASLRVRVSADGAASRPEGEAAGRLSLWKPGQAEEATRPLLGRAARILGFGRADP